MCAFYLLQVGDDLDGARAVSNHPYPFIREVVAGLVVSTVPDVTDFVWKLLTLLSSAPNASPRPQSPSVQGFGARPDRSGSPWQR
jgi:hypothetical protein